MHISIVIHLNTRIPNMIKFTYLHGMKETVKNLSDVKTLTLVSMCSVISYTLCASN